MDSSILTLIIVLVSVLLSMTLHEAMHAFASYWLGDDTAKHMGRLTLNPLAHIDLFTTVLLPVLLVAAGAPPFGVAKPVPFNPSRLKYGEFGAALVGLAGPLTNLLLAVIAGLVLQLFGSDLPHMAAYILGIFTLVNLSFFLFNIIPFPPLDGSRVLYAVAPDPVTEVMERIEAMGFIAIGVFFVIFYMFLSGPFSRLLSSMLQIITGGTVVI
jgi:Zn-dependent protease